MQLERSENSFSILKNFENDFNKAHYKKSPIQERLSDDDEDVEFDNTLDEIIDNPTGKVSLLELNRSRNYFEKSSVNTAPLKKYNESFNSGQKSSITGTPKPINTVKPKNGTPIHNFHAEKPKSIFEDVQGDYEDKLIRQEKLISSDNKFSPRRTSKVSSSSVVNSSPLKSQASSLLSNRNLISNVVDLETGHLGAKNGENKVLKKLIDQNEFEQAIKTRRNDMNISTSTPFVTNGPGLLDRIGMAAKDEGKPNSYISKSSIASYSPSKRVTNNSRISPRDMESIQANNKQTLPAIYDSNLSKEAIIEKINRTVDSLRERDFLSSPRKMDNNIDDKDLDSDAGSNDGPTEILNEIDSFMKAKKETLSEPVYPSNHTYEKNVAVSANLVSVPDDYLNREDPEEIEIPTLASLPLSTEKIDPYANKEKKVSKPRGNNWNRKKWAVLKKIISNKALSVNDIMNSTVLTRNLQCSKSELKLRIEFLVSNNAKIDE